MIFTTSSGKRVGVVWHYDHFMPTKENENLRVATTCTAYDFSVDPPAIAAQVVSKLKGKGNHCKDSARKASLLRTMRVLGFDKEQRYKIWQQYFAARWMVLDGSELKAIEKPVGVERGTEAAAAVPAEQTA